VSVKGDQEGRVVGDNPAVVVADVLLAVGGLQNGLAVLGPCESHIIALANRREITVRLGEALRAGAPVCLGSNLAICVLVVIASAVNHVTDNGLSKSS